MGWGCDFVYKMIPCLWGLVCRLSIVALLFCCSDQEQEEMESGDVHVIRTRFSLQRRRPPRLGGLVHFDDRRRHRLHLQLGQGVDGFVRLWQGGRRRVCQNTPDGQRAGRLVPGKMYNSIKCTQSVEHDLSTPPPPPHKPPSPTPPQTPSPTPPQTPSPTPPPPPDPNPYPSPPNNINTAHRGPFQVNVERWGKIFR